jgi:hypothetical protein
MIAPLFALALWLRPAAAIPLGQTLATASTSTSTRSEPIPKPYRQLTPLLDTPWTSQVGTNPWPQHPRPLLYRDRWQTLNGIWTYQPATRSEDVAKPPALPMAEEVLIPSCIEGAISGIMASGLMHMWFGTTFTVPSDWPSENRVLLNFESVDYEATVFVNGKNVGFNRGGYFRFTLDITDHVKPNGTNEL